MKNLLLLVFSFIILSSCGRNKIDNSDNNVSKIIDKTVFENIHSADSILLKIEKIERKFANEDSLLAEMLFSGGVKLYQFSDYESAGKMFFKAEKLFEKLKMQKRAIQMRGNQAVINELTGNYFKAVETYLSILSYYQQISDTLAIKKVYNNLAILYEEMEFPQKALSFHRQALKLGVLLNDSMTIAKTSNNIGVLYMELLHNNDSAMFYFQKALPIFENSQKTNNNNLATLYLNMAYVNTGKKNYEYAIKELDKALKISKNNNDKSSEARVLRAYGNLFIDRGEYNKAKKYFEESSELFSVTEEKLKVIESYYQLFRVHNLLGQTNLAVEYVDKYIQMKDSLLSEKNRKLVVQLESKYQLQEKNKSIQLLEYENLAKERSIRTRTVLLISMMIILILFFVIFYHYSKGKLAQEEKMRLEIDNYLLEINIYKERAHMSEIEREERLMAQIKKFELTKREGDVLMCMYEGKKNIEIADDLYLSINTVKSHVKNIYIKLDVRNRKDAISRVG